MKLLSSTAILSSSLNLALAQSLRRSLMPQSSSNYEIVGTPQVSEISRTMPAGYSITFTNRWTEENHPYEYPFMAHWSDFVYASHSANYQMWCNGCLASAGVESIAEEGQTGTLIEEIEDERGKGSVLDQVLGLFIPRATDGSASSPRKDLCVDESHPYVSAISMIAPTPDWFSGLYDLRLWDQSTKNWYEKIELNVYAWDAGTEEGNGYSLDNIETDPQEEISPFVAGTTAAA
eukprot:13496785-Ditylum_brightwellii.AAC.1